MGALTVGKERRRAAEHELLQAPVAAAKRIFGGALVARDAAGNAVPAANTAGLRLLGVSEEWDVNNLAGAAGDRSVKVRSRGRYTLAASGLAAGDEGKLLFVVDDDTGALTTTQLITIGPIAKVLSATSAEVELDPTFRLTQTPLAAGTLGAGLSAAIVQSLTLPAGHRAYLHRVAAWCKDVTGAATVDVLLDGETPATILDDPITLADDTRVAGVVVTRDLPAGSKLDVVATTAADTGAVVALVVELTYQVL